MWFGQPRPPEIIYLPHKQYEWNPESFNILGITFTTSLNQITDINLDKKYLKLQEDIQRWKTYKLTPYGKITVLRTLIISQIVHILMALPSPSEPTIKRIENLMFNFLWDGKPDKIKRSVAFRKPDKGGLNMIDIRKFITAIKCSWVRRMSKDTYNPWVTILANSTDNFENWTKFGIEFLSNLHKKTNYVFWEEVSYLLRNFIKH